MYYQLNEKKRVQIPDSDLKRIMDGLQVDKEEAIEIWLEDEGYIDNEEQIALDKKAKESGLSRTIHEAKSTTARKPRTVTRKEDKTKEGIIAMLAEALKEVAENVQIVNIGKIITFTLGEDNFKLDLIRQRKPKEGGGK